MSVALEKNGGIYFMLMQFPSFLVSLGFAQEREKKILYSSNHTSNIGKVFSSAILRACSRRSLSIIEDSVPLLKNCEVMIKTWHKLWYCVILESNFFSLSSEFGQQFSDRLQVKIDKYTQTTRMAVRLEAIRVSTSSTSFSTYRELWIS